MEACLHGDADLRTLERVFNFCCAAECILDSGDFVLAGSPGDPSWVNLGKATSSKESKTTTNVPLL